MLQKFPNCKLLLRYALSLSVLLLPAAVVRTTAAIEISTDVIVVTDSPAPDGIGTIVDLGGAVLNDRGQVAFVVRYFSDPPFNGPFGLLLSDGSGGLATLARTNDSPPDGNGRFRDVGSFPLLNNAGQVVFHSDLTDFSGGLLNNQGLYLAEDLGNGASNVQEIVRAGDATPDGSSMIRDFDSPVHGVAVLNDAGQVAFRGYDSPFSGSNSALYLSNGNGDHIEIVREGDAAPDGIGNYSSLSGPALNEAGQVAFAASFTGTSSSDIRRAIYRRESMGELVQIVITGGVAPDGNGSLLVVSDVSLNDAGQVVYMGLLTGTSGGRTDNTALYLGDGTGEPVQLVRNGDSVPGGIGRFAKLGDPFLNNAGQTVFNGDLVDTINFGDDTGLFRSDAEGGLVKIAREGDDLPAGVGEFGNLGTSNGSAFSGTNAAINDAGQVAFVADLKGIVGGSDHQGLYLYDDRLGLTQLARTGDPLMGSTITGLFFLDGSGGFGNDLGNERSALNEAGQVAYLFTLADGREGIAIASLVPEPSTLLLGMLVSGLMMRRARRRPIAPR